MFLFGLDSHLIEEKIENFSFHYSFLTFLAQCSKSEEDLLADYCISVRLCALMLRLE